MSEMMVLKLQTEAGQMYFSDASEMARWRVQSVKTKEPSTIEWLDTFEQDKVFFDVGANMGLYTIWSAVRRGVRVHAFEPVAENFAVLNRNIRLNQLSDRATGWPIAAYHRHEIGTLYISKPEIAGSCHSFNEKLSPKLEEQDFGIMQGAVSWPLDELVARGTPPSPDYVKIDVDGLEHRVIEGMKDIIASGHMQSRLIELTPSVPEHSQIIETLQAAGYAYDPEQVERATRTEGYWEGTGEYIFHRKT